MGRAAVIEQVGRLFASAGVVLHLQEMGKEAENLWQWLTEQQLKDHFKDPGIVAEVIEVHGYAKALASFSSRFCIIFPLSLRMLGSHWVRLLAHAWCSIAG